MVFSDILSQNIFQGLPQEFLPEIIPTIYPWFILRKFLKHGFHSVFFAWFLPEILPKFHSEFLPMFFPRMPQVKDFLRSSSQGFSWNVLNAYFCWSSINEFLWHYSGNYFSYSEKYQGGNLVQILRKSLENFKKY